jgi:hypothetical protein
MINSEYTSIAIWVTMVLRKHHNVGVSAWVDGVLVPPIVVGSKIDSHGFVSIYNIVEEHELCTVGWLDM